MIKLYRRRLSLFVSVFVVGYLAGGSLFAEGNWPQFRGPNRDGVSTDTGLLKAWPEEGPKLLWQSKGAGRGYASCCIADGNLYTIGDAPSTADDKDEYLLAFELDGGKPTWKTRLGKAWSEGPDDWQSSRGTPTFDNGRLYSLTAHGDLVAVDAADGKVVWKKNLKDDFDGKKGDGWGYGESVLIDGEWLLCTPGGEENTIVALNKSDGELVWSAKQDENRGAGHASIQVSHVAGEKVYVQTTAQGVIGVRASDGKVLWNYDIERMTAVIPSPIIRDDLVFFSVGYGLGGALLRQVPADGGVQVREVYGINKELANKHGGVVLVGDSVFGDSGDKGAPFCADLMTGARQWRERGSGRGSAAVSAADGYLYFLFHNSTMVLAKADPDGYEEVGSFKLPGSENPRPTWAHPTITDGKLYVRQDDLIFCYDISG